VFAGDLQDKHPYLYNQGVWIFGDWDKALLAAGFGPKMMRLHTFWDQDRIIKEIHGMRDQNLPLYPRYMIKNHRNLFSGALRHFGTWSKALRAAGITQTSKVMYWSRLTLLRELRDTLVNGSKDNIPQTLRLQATHYFGSLRNAFLAMRKDQRLLRGWSKQKIVLTLSRMHRSKESLAYARARRDVSGLVSAPNPCRYGHHRAATIGRSSKGCQLSRNTIHRLGNGATVYKS
jgi:hypothetical protein